MVTNHVGVAHEVSQLRVQFRGVAILVLHTLGEAGETIIPLSETVTLNRLLMPHLIPFTNERLFGWRIYA